MFKLNADGVQIKCRTRPPQFDEIHQRQAARPATPDNQLMRVRPETLTDRHASTAGGGANARDTRPRASRSPRRVPMSERPEADDDWSTFDHWEADDVIEIGANLHTEVGKKTRFLMASVIPNKTAEQNIGVQQLAIFAPLPAGARLIIMHGNGIESARLRNGLGMDIYFADPYSS